MLVLHHKIDAKTAKGILALRKRISVPAPELDVSINIATWNIREFGRKRRNALSIEYIAEIVSYFDLVAITELRRNTKDLERVMKILGPYWKVIYSDATMDRGGNYERIGYLYDSRVITFTGLAAEADPIRKKNRKTGEYESNESWWRSPYLVSFRAGRFDFVVLSVHIRWGDSTEQRKDALERLAIWVDKRRKIKGIRNKDVLVMGDFNIPEHGDDLYKAVTSKGLRAPEDLLGKGTNLSGKKSYDQILYYPVHTRNITHAGVVEFAKGGIKELYSKSDYPDLDEDGFTYQMSDHLPVWVQLDVTDDEDLVELSKAG